jgi:hypothetical protein
MRLPLRTSLALAGLLQLGAVGCHRSPSTGADGGAASLSALPAAPAVDVIVLRDADAYSVAVARGAMPCILYPDAMYDATMCPVEARPLQSPPAGPSRSRLVALGLVRFMDKNAPQTPQMGQLTVNLNRMDHPHQPTQESAQAVGSGMVDSFTRSVAGAMLGAGGPSVRLMTTDAGLQVARISFDATRVTGDTPRMEHSVSFTVWSTEGAYTFSLTSRQQYAEVMDALAAQMAASLRVAHPAAP